jgi:hypothetical protein
MKREGWRTRRIEEKEDTMQEEI